MRDIWGGVEQIVDAVTGICPYYGAAIGPRMRFTIPKHQYFISARKGEIRLHGLS
jgi:hypothetical protein